MPRWTNEQRAELEAELQQVREDRERLEQEITERTAAAVVSVAEAARAYGGAGQALDRAVAEARAFGANWADIGRAVGITRQAAAQRWGGEDR
jgi:ribosomal protein L9